MDNPQTEKTIPDRTNAGDGITVWDALAMEPKETPVASWASLELL